MTVALRGDDVTHNRREAGSVGDMVTYPSDGATGTGYLALPASGAGPGVIVIQEWWGLVPHIRSLADRFAEAGFVALAPDLYHGAVTSEPDEARRLLMGMAMDKAALDIGGAARYLAERPEVAAVPHGPDRIAAVGFCAGGSLALWSATLNERIAVTVGFYPAMPWERMQPTWDNYTGKVALIHCSEGDGTSAAPGIQAARKAIEEAGGQVIVYDYPGTQHAFFNDDRPEVYHARAAASAWARTLELLRSRLG